MADFRLLSEILNDNEMRQLSHFLKVKIESHLVGKKTTIDNMRSQLANSSANDDKKGFVVDRELQNTKFKLQLNEDFLEKLKNYLKETEEALQKSRHEYYEILESKDSLIYELNTLKEQLNRNSDENSNLKELLNRRQEEIQSLQQELNTICSKLKTNNEGILETSVKAGELELKMVSIQHQEIRMNQERHLYQKQIEALNEELNSKINELMSLRRDKTIQIFELQSSLELKTDENNKYMEDIKHLKQVVEKKDKHIESLAQRMCEMQHFRQQLEEDFQNEITAQKNLIELHKQSNNDLKKSNENLLQTIEEMQKLLQSAKEAHNELETTFSECQSRFSQRLSESMEENSTLVRELEDLKKSMADTSRELEFEQQYPLAANTKKVLAKNMSFTQIFHELSNKQKELEEQKNENTILKEHLQHLSTEAEENAPLLHRKIQEHQRALQNVIELQKQLSNVMTEREQWLQEKDSLIRINKHYEREITRFESENRDLSKQIRVLIKSVQEARGFRVAQVSQITSSDSFRESSGVPQELLTFKDIEELQIRNQELINALRETTEKLRRVETEKNDQRMQSVRTDLDEALSHLESLRAERRQQTEMVETLVKQRDLYKTLASHQSPDPNQKFPVAFTTSSFSSVSAEEHNKLKSNFDELKEEYEKCREEGTHKINLLTENNNKLREELSNLKIESSKISSELCFTLEKLEMFNTNCEQFQRENALLRERNTVLSENSKKLEHNVIVMRQEVLSLNEKLNRFEINIESLKSERDLYRNNEQKLLQEKEIMIRNEETQNRLINTLKSVQNNLDQMETNSIKNLKKVLETQSHDNNSKLEEKTNEVKKLTEELNALKNENITNQNTISQLRKVAKKYKVQFEELKVQFDKLSEKRETIAPPVVVLDSKSAEDSAEILKLQQKIEALNSKITELNAKIKEFDQQIDKMNIDLSQVTEEREAAKAQALEKEERAKKIAQQAKLRLDTIKNEKLNIIKEKEMFEKSTEELKEKVKQMEQSCEESALRMASIKSQYEAKAARFEKELSEANKQIESLRTRQQQKPTQPPMATTSAAIGVTNAYVQTSQTPSNAVRHSVQPQPVSAKSTPTASIRPLAVAPTLHRSGRTTVAARMATVAAVQPTTEESTSHQSVPQATVQPTQTVPSQMVIVPPHGPTSTSEAEVIVSHSDEQFEDSSLSQPNTEMPEIITHFAPTVGDDNNSQPSISDERSSPPNIAFDPTQPETSQTETCEASTSVKIDRKRTREMSSEVSAGISGLTSKKLRAETENLRPIETIQQKESPVESMASQNQPIVEEEDDDEVIIVESDESDVEQTDEPQSNAPEYEEEDEEDEEEDDYEEEEEEDNEENVEESEEIYAEDNEQYADEEEEEEEDDDESHYDEEQNEENSDGNDGDDIEVIGISESDDLPESNANDQSDERQEQSEASTSESIEPNVSTTMSSSVTSVVTSSTETNPFMQIPTPIQRTGFVTSGRQSLYLSHAQQTYDEGDGIVPSTPTLYVPRRGDGLSDPLNSPRVPQSRFVFNASIPEATPLSQLATETTLGVDHTQMDLSQFDDNNGRSVPTTPLATSPTNNSVHSTVQNIDIDNDSDQNFGIDPNVTETIIPTEFETDSSIIETEKPETSISADTSDYTETEVQQMPETSETQTQSQEQSSIETTQQSEETIVSTNQFESEAIPSSTSMSTSAPVRGSQMARRGRAFTGGAQRAALQRRPILAPTSPSPGAVPPNRQPTPVNVSPNHYIRAQMATRQPTGRTIRLRYSRFSSQQQRGNFRGRPNRGSGGGGYNN